MPWIAEVYTHTQIIFLFHWFMNFTKKQRKIEIEFKKLKINYHEKMDLNMYYCIPI